MKIPVNKNSCSIARRLNELRYSEVLAIHSTAQEQKQVENTDAELLKEMLTRAGVNFRHETLGEGQYIEVNALDGSQNEGEPECNTEFVF